MKKEFAKRPFIFAITLLCLTVATCKKEASTSRFNADLNLSKSSIKMSPTAVNKSILCSSNADSNTKHINDALSNPNIRSVVLTYNANGWEIGPIIMNVENQELVIAGKGSAPGRLIASKTPKLFLSPTSRLLRIAAKGCVINGYSDSLIKAKAILQMFKNDYTNINGYTPSGSRAGIYTVGMSNITIKGIYIKDAGGDGIYIRGGQKVNITDVVSDGANRNSISVIKANNLAITNCEFINTTGDSSTGSPTGPWAGIDIEPVRATDTIGNITLSNCKFTNNKGPGILMIWDYYKILGGISTPVNIKVINCTVSGGQYGMKIRGMTMDGPANNGVINFENCQLNNPVLHGIFIHNWPTGRTRLYFDKCSIYNAGSTPIRFNHTLNDYKGGNLNFKACRVDDFKASPYILYASNLSLGSGFQDVTGLETSEAPALSVKYWNAIPANKTPVRFIPIATENITLNATIIK